MCLPREFTEHKPAFELKYRDMAGGGAWRKSRPVQTQCYACTEYNYDWFVNDLENPYSTPAGKPFSWQTAAHRGRKNTVLGAAKLSPEQSRPEGGEPRRLWAGLAGLLPGTDPFYNIVEEYVGISGAAEGNDALPDGHFLPPMKMTCGEVHFRESMAKNFGRTVTIGRSAIITQVHNGRAACHYCGTCERGCVSYSYFSSPFTTVKDALDTGKCTLLTNAVVAHVEMDPSTNLATGVTYVDGATRQTKTIRAKAVILCAQALESTRILLNSSTDHHTAGLGNSSGLLGRGLMDHSTGAGASGELPQFQDAPDPYSGPHRANGIYVIRYRNTTKSTKQPNFIRGYGFQGSAGAEFNYGAEGFGAAFTSRR